MASKSKVLTETIIFNVSPQLKAWAQQGAQQNHIPFSEYLRRILETELKRQKIEMPEDEQS